MVARVLVAPGQVLVSRPGFDVFSAGADQLLLGAGVYPQQIMQAGQIATSGGSATVTFGFDPGYVPVCLFQSSDGSSADYPYQVSNTGGGSFPPPVYRSLETFRTIFSVSGADRIVGYIVFRSAY